MRHSIKVFFASTILLVFSGCSTIPGGGTIHMPEGDGTFPVVFVLHTSGGLSNHEKAFASKLSDHGYVSIAVDWWSGDGTSLPDSYDYIIAQPFINPDQVGLVGFSRGGRAALWFASRLEVMSSPHKITGVVNYYQGNSIVPWIQNTPHPPVLFLHGEKDEYVEPIEIYNYCDIHRKNGYVCEYKIYPGVRHAFDMNTTQWGANDSEVTEDAWNRTLEFLDKHVRGNQ